MSARIVGDVCQYFWKFVNGTLLVIFETFKSSELLLFTFISDKAYCNVSGNLLINPVIYFCSPLFLTYNI